MKPEQTYHVYKFQNLINGKIYIGKSINIDQRYYTWSNSHRWKHSKFKSLLSRAFSKYGFENFSFEIIGNYEDGDKMNEMEMYYINHFHSISPNGYNLSHQKDDHICQHEDTKKLISIHHQGKSKTWKDIETNTVYVGVRKDSKTKYSARVQDNGVSRCKNFATAEEAAKGYDRMVLFLYGKNASINFENLRNEYLKEDLSKFYNKFITSSQKKDTKFISVFKIKSNNKWAVVLNRKIPEIKELQMKQYDTDEEAAIMADKINHFFNLNQRYNFPEKVSTYDLKELGEYFANNKKNYSSKYKGVCKKGKKWSAYFSYNGKQTTISCKYNSEEEAYLDRKRVLLEHNMTE